MEVCHSIAAFRAARAHMGPDLGLVPTMGYLHAGHISLVERARADCAHVAATIFVNPTQFGANEDFGSYPRDLPRDLQLLEATGCDLVLAPPVEEIYPPGFATTVLVGGVTEMLEGATRPGHFAGVATVVCKLLNIAQPRLAFFGQKDIQQTVVIRRMVADLNIPSTIVVCPTRREPDGLAMSSRNVYLAPPERAAATVLYRALSAAQASYASGERNAENLRIAMRAVLAAEPLARPDYVSVADLESMRELEQIAGPAVASLAVRIGRTRLIDNFVLE